MVMIIHSTFQNAPKKTYYSFDGNTWKSLYPNFLDFLHILLEISVSLKQSQFDVETTNFHALWGHTG